MDRETANAGLFGPAAFDGALGARLTFGGLRGTATALTVTREPDATELGVEGGGGRALTAWLTRVRCWKAGRVMRVLKTPFCMFTA